MPRLSSVSCCLTSPTSHLPRCTPDPFFTISKLHHQILGAHGRGLGSFGIFLVFLCFRGHVSWSEHWVKSSHWPAEHQSQVPVPGGSSVSVTMVKNQRLEGGGRGPGLSLPRIRSAQFISHRDTGSTLNQTNAATVTQKWVGSAAQGAKEKLPGSSACFTKVTNTITMPFLMSNHCCYF